MIAFADTAPAQSPLLCSNRDRLSYREIQTYMACPLRYYFRYVEQAREPTTSASLAFGHAFHSALRFHFETIVTGTAQPDVYDLVEEFWAAWHTRADTVAIIDSKGDIESETDEVATRVLDAFLQSPASKPPGRIIGLAEELSGSITADLPEILAHVDLITETNASFILTDFKSSRCRWDTEQAEDAADKLRLFHEFARRQFCDKPIQLQVVVVSKTKHPCVQLIPLDDSPQRTRQLTRTIQQVWKAIKSHIYYPVRSRIHCSTCPFREPCDEWGN